jgi:hypothetical protein
MPTSANRRTLPDAARPGSPTGASTSGDLPPPAGAEGACRALWIALLALTVARAALAFVPSMWAWSLNLIRFIEPAAGWALWGVAALALVPAIARRATPALAAAGEALARRPGPALAAGAAGAAALVVAFPDRVGFVGDFLLRQYTLEGRPSAVAAWYPHALPLDLLLHDTLGRALMRVGVAAGDTGRLLGAVEAAALMGAAIAFARVLRLRSVAAAAAAGVVFFGGYLTMFTGYNKAFSEMPLVVAAFAVTALRLVRDGGPALPPALVLALAFVLHRSALGLLPVAVVTGALWSRAHPGAWRRPASLATLALPVVTLAVMLPRTIAIITRVDPMHFAPEEVRQAGGILPGLVLGSRLADLANLLPMLSPLALAAPAMALALGRSLPWRAEGLLLATLALPFVATMPFIHPGQGYHRDWDDFAAPGMTLSLIAAWLVGRALERSPRHAWLGVAALLGAAAPSLQWLVHHGDVNRGLARVETFLREPPRRGDSERARTWDYLGWRLTDLGRYEGAAAAFARLAELQPSPRVMRQWAATEALRGDPRRAQEIYRQMLTRFPDVAAGWFELARLSYEMGDLAEARRAAGEMLRLDPGRAATREFIAHLDSLRRARGE